MAGKALKLKRNFRRKYGPFSGTWKRAHPEFQPQPISVIPDTYQTLQVWNEHFRANCLWKRSMGTWICIQSEPPVLWMKGMEKGKAKLEIARMGLNYIWLTASLSQEANAAGPITEQGSGGVPQITRHEMITGGPDRTNTGDGAKAGNCLPLTGSIAESISLPTGSLRGSSLPRPVESSSASVHQGSSLEMPVQTAVGPKLQTEEQSDTHKSLRVKPSHEQVTQSIQAY